MLLFCLTLNYANKNYLNDGLHPGRNGADFLHFSIRTNNWKGRALFRSSKSDSKLNFRAEIGVDEKFAKYISWLPCCIRDAIVAAEWYKLVSLLPLSGASHIRIGVVF
jgi:hypothetical protein